MRDFDCLVKRYLNIFLVKPKFLLITVVIPILFYVYTLTIPISYEISNSIACTGETVFDLPGPDRSLVSRENLLLEPDLIFLNGSLVAELNHLITRNWENRDAGNTGMNESIMESLSLELSGDDQLKVIYRGPQLSAGSMMVYFYSRKLLSHSATNEITDQERSSGITGAAGIGFYNMNLEVLKHYGLWNQDRLYPLGMVIVFSFLIMMIVVGVAEWMDSSLKTEQQASRYLDLPVLGAFPNFQELGTILNSPTGTPDSEDHFQA